MSKPKKVILVVLTIILPIILFVIFMEFSIYRATIMIGGYHPWQYRGWKKDFLAFLSELYDGEVNFLQHKEVGPVYASGACHVRNEYIINDNHIFLDLIVFPHNATEVVLIICEGKAIDEEMIEKIVISFRIKNKNIKGASKNLPKNQKL